MSDEASKPDPIVCALRDRLFELNHQRDLAEMAMREIDARIAEVNEMIAQFAPKRGRGRPKGTGMRIVPAELPEPPGDVPTPEDAA